MEIFTWTPDAGAPETETARLHEANFGGYAQRAPAGLNAIDRTVDVVFTVRTITEIKAISDFLMNHRGAMPFLWRGEAYVCGKWKNVYASDATVPDASLTATFERTTS